MPKLVRRQPKSPKSPKLPRTPRERRTPKQAKEPKSEKLRPKRVHLSRQEERERKAAAVEKRRNGEIDEHGAPMRGTPRGGGFRGGNGPRRPPRGNNRGRGGAHVRGGFVGHGEWNHNHAPQNQQQQWPMHQQNAQFYQQAHNAQNHYYPLEGANIQFIAQNDDEVAEIAHAPPPPPVAVHSPGLPDGDDKGADGDDAKENSAVTAPESSSTSSSSSSTSSSDEKTVIGKDGKKKKMKKRNVYLKKIVAKRAQSATTRDSTDSDSSAEDSDDDDKKSAALSTADATSSSSTRSTTPPKLTALRSPPRSGTKWKSDESSSSGSSTDDEEDKKKVKENGGGVSNEATVAAVALLPVSDVVPRVETPRHVKDECADRASPILNLPPVGHCVENPGTAYEMVCAETLNDVRVRLAAKENKEKGETGGEVEMPTSSKSSDQSASPPAPHNQSVSPTGSLFSQSQPPTDVMAALWRLCEIEKGVEGDVSVLLAASVKYAALARTADRLVHMMVGQGEEIKAAKEKLLAGQSSGEALKATRIVDLSAIHDQLAGPNDMESALTALDAIGVEAPNRSPTFKMPASKKRAASDTAKTAAKKPPVKRVPKTK